VCLQGPPAPEVKVSIFPFNKNKQKKGAAGMFLYMKAVYFEVLIEAFCFLKYKHSYFISDGDN